MLNFIDVNKADAKIQNVKLVEKAKFHYARGCVYISLVVEILSGEAFKVFAAHLKLQMLDIVVDHLRPNALKFVHSVFLMLRLDGDSPVLDHEA